MKIEILKTLKNGKTFYMPGEILTDPIPKEVLDEVRLDRGVVRVIEATPVQQEIQEVIPLPSEEPAAPQTEGASSEKPAAFTKRKGRRSIK